MSFPIDLLARGLAVSAAGVLALLALRRASAATRHAAATVALGAMLVLPLGMIAAPKRTVVVAPFVPIGRVAPSFPAPPEALAPAQVPARDPFPVATVLFAVWTAGALGIVLRTLAGWLTAYAWARRAIAAADDAAMDVRVSAEVPAPCALWAGRPVVLLPAECAGWSEERRRAVLLHETAHVRRGDWAALVLARLAVALHWPNPLAWALARAARRAAEDAADDAVLDAGLPPADYADLLLALAPRRSRPALVLPMAARPDLHRRIRNVLNPHRTRGSVGFAALALSSLLVGGVLVPAACLVAGRAQGPIALSSGLRPDRSRPGTSANGFVGRFPDGTTAQVVQISMHTPRGIVAWRPDGTPIPESGRRSVGHLGPHYRSILVRYDRRDRSPEGGLGSGPSTGGEPSVLGFNSDRGQPGPRPGEWESYSFVEVPKEDGDRASFTFALANEPWRTYRMANEPWGGHDRLAPQTPFRPGRRGGSGDLRSVIVSRTFAAPARRGADGLYAKDAHGGLLRGKVPSTALSFLPARDGKVTVAEVSARLRRGGTVRPFWNDNGQTDGEPSFRYHFRQRPEAIASFEIRTRGYQDVEFLDVRLKPRGG